MSNISLYDEVKNNLPKDAKHIRAWLSFIRCFNSVDSVLLNHFSKEFNSSLRRYDVLSALVVHSEGLTMGDLARLLMVTKGNVTAVIRRLQQEKLVLKKTSTSDRRVSLVKVSKKGHNLWAKMHEDYDKIVSILLSGLSHEQLETFVRVTDEARVAVEKKWAEAGYSDVC